MKAMQTKMAPINNGDQGFMAQIARLITRALTAFFIALEPYQPYIWSAMLAGLIEAKRRSLPLLRTLNFTVTGVVMAAFLTPLVVEVLNIQSEQSGSGVAFLIGTCGAGFVDWIFFKLTGWSRQETIKNHDKMAKITDKSEK